MTRSGARTVGMVGAGLLMLAGLWLLSSDLILRLGSPGGMTSAALVLMPGHRQALQGDAGAFSALPSACGAVGCELAWAPIAPQAWLELAAATSAQDAERRQAALGMACMTGPAVVDLMPARIALAVQTGAISDTLIRQCVSTDLLYILLKQTSLKPAIVEIDQRASAFGRDRLRAIIRDIDPAFATSLATM